MRIVETGGGNHSTGTPPALCKAIAFVRVLATLKTTCGTRLPCTHNNVVVGVDEVGRGPLAGPVVAAAVILSPAMQCHWARLMLRDSKKLNPQQRMRIAHALRSAAYRRPAHVTYRLGQASAAEIDCCGLTAATNLAVRRALDRLNYPWQTIFLDGRTIPAFLRLKRTQHVIPLIKADTYVPAVQAAAILAKVARDKLMVQLHKRYPAYGFGQHKGYGTKAHYQAIEQWGRITQHRLSFLYKKNLIINNL